MTTRTLEEPLGSDHDCLIVCNSDAHRRVVSEALQIPARYILQFSSLMGWRFSKIIVFTPHDFMSDGVRDRWERWVNEDLRTRLDVECRNNLYVI